MTSPPLSELQAWRKELHRHPEVSGEEEWTAGEVAQRLQSLNPDQLQTGLGGYGILARFRAKDATRRVMLRCELDGLPIQEINEFDHASTIAGRGHLCGHDGHMAIIMAVAHQLSAQRIGGLDVGLLFQPAEETGAGAKAVIESPEFAEFAPDIVLSLHNLPGLALGQVRVKPGPLACASRGMRIKLIGKTAHASQPETGHSPARAMIEIMEKVAGWNAPALPGALPSSMATLTHANLGEPTYGIAPGEAEVWVTLRTPRDAQMNELCALAEKTAQQIAANQDLKLEFEYHDIFLDCTNDAALALAIEQAAKAAGVSFAPLEEQMRWSEDFGRFGAEAQAAMFVIGAGENSPALHNPDYDFPDEIIAPAADVFMGCLHLIARDFT